MEQHRFEVIHRAVAGRIRLRCRALRRNARLAKRLEDAALGQAGVRDAEADPNTGSLLIWHHSNLELSALTRRLDRLVGEQVDDTITAGRTTAQSGARPRAPTAAGARRRTPWHALDVAEVLNKLDSGAEGLTGEEAAARLQRQGPNALPRPQQRTDLAILAAQVKSPPVAMLGASAVVSIASGGLLDAAAIGTVVAINSVIGFATERQSERTIAAMGDAAPLPVKVVRNAQAQAIGAEDLVPGDVLVLAPGTRVAADARLLSTQDLSIDEAPLTGESMPVSKSADAVLSEDTALGDRDNLVHMGTSVAGGSGHAVVVATGLDTEIGQVQAMVGEAQAPTTPVKRQLNALGTRLAWISAGICGGVFVLGVLRGQSTLQMLKSAVSLAVAAVPEGLPAVATTTLALGIRDMRKRKVLVRRLDAVETLGAVQELCLDKTGTLTENRMALAALRTPAASLTGESADSDDADTRLRLLETVCLCSEVAADGDGELQGSATELALVQAAVDEGVDLARLRKRWPQRSLQQRALHRPYMLSRHPGGGKRVLTAIKGSPEHVLGLCSHYQRGGRRRPLDDKSRSRILADNSRLAGGALRVLGVARSLAQDGGAEEPPQGLTWLGLAGLADPLRPGMKALLERFHRAGVNTMIITGDQSATAYAVARELAIAGDGTPIEILDSAALDRLDPDVLAGVIRKVQVFSRVSPAHKLQIVNALQRAGRVVAMTGDGINDGPALKAADLGIALGGTGTDVARAMADIVVEDDNLQTLEVALRDGRTVYSNIRKSIRYLIATNLSEIELMLAGVAIGGTPPLTPMQLLWINLVSDVFPALALALEPGESDVLERPPRSPDEPIVSGHDLGTLTVESLLMTGAALASYGLGMLRGGPAVAGTMAFTTLTTSQLLHAVSSRSEHTSALPPAGLPPNPQLRRAVGISLGAQALTLLLPPLRRLLGSSPLGPLQAITAGVGGSLPFLALELHKLLQSSRRSVETTPSSQPRHGDDPA